MRKQIFVNGLSILLLILIIHIPCDGYAQYSGKKNTVRVNVTNPIILGKGNLVFGYERTIGKHQSFSVDVGLFSLPALNVIPHGDSLGLAFNRSKKGFHFSGDYRFYLSKENKYESPHGVYIGPYVSHNSFSRKNTWMADGSFYQGEFETKLDVALNTVGFELGYQFVLWDRLAIDCILMGPGLTNYKIDVGISAAVGPDVENQVYQDIYRYLSNKIPGFNLVIDENKFLQKGGLQTTTIGYRYMINLGYRF